jgi:hypothetical protein
VSDNQFQKIFENIRLKKENKFVYKPKISKVPVALPTLSEIFKRKRFPDRPITPKIPLDDDTIF